MRAMHWPQLAAVANLLSKQQEVARIPAPVARTIYDCCQGAECPCAERERVLSRRAGTSANSDQTWPHRRHPDDVAAAVRFRAPHCVAGCATELNITAAGMMQGVAYRLLVTVMRGGDVVCTDETWSHETGVQGTAHVFEHVLPPLSAGPHTMRVTLFDAAVGQKEEAMLTSMVQRLDVSEDPAAGAAGDTCAGHKPDRVRMGNPPYQWIHPAKTGTSFGNCLYALVCAQELQQAMDPSRNVSEVSIRKHSGFQFMPSSCRTKWYMTTHNAIGRKLNSEFIIGEHYHWFSQIAPSSTFVSLRSPANRLRSWSQSNGLLNSSFCQLDYRSLVPDDFLIWDEYHRYSYASMLGGESLTGTDSQALMKLACARLSKVAWIGLTDYFEASVCLLHHLYPHRAHPKELDNVRPTLNSPVNCPGLFVQFSSKFLKEEEEVYLCGVQRFVRDLYKAPHCGSLIDRISPYETSESEALLGSLMP